MLLQFTDRTQDRCAPQPCSHVCCSSWLQAARWCHFAQAGCAARESKDDGILLTESQVAAAGRTSNHDHPAGCFGTGKSNRKAPAVLLPRLPSSIGRTANSGICRPAPSASRRFWCCASCSLCTCSGMQDDTLLALLQSAHQQHELLQGGKLQSCCPDTQQVTVTQCTAASEQDDLTLRLACSAALSSSSPSSCFRCCRCCSASPSARSCSGGAGCQEHVTCEGH